MKVKETWTTPTVEECIPTGPRFANFGYLSLGEHNPRARGLLLIGSAGSVTFHLRTMATHGQIRVIDFECPNCSAMPLLKLPINNQWPSPINASCGCGTEYVLSHDGEIQWIN